MLGEAASQTKILLLAQSQTFWPPKHFGLATPLALHPFVCSMLHRPHNLLKANNCWACFSLYFVHNYIVLAVTRGRAGLRLDCA